MSFSSKTMEYQLFGKKIKKDIKMHYIKIILIGEPSVGKSSILIRYMYNIFYPQYHETKGLDYAMKIVNLTNPKPIKIYLWDLAGRSEYQTMIRTYYHNTNVAIIVYDITNAESFKCVPQWIDKVKDILPDVKIVLVANKQDLKEKRQVSLAENEAMVKKYKLQFIECSASTGYNIKNIFTQIYNEADYSKLPYTDDNDKLYNQRDCHICW